MTTKDGCKHCPAGIECEEMLTYRGSACSALRHRLGADFDPVSRGEQARMSNEALSTFFCANTNCNTCMLFKRCDTSKEYPLLEYLEGSGKTIRRKSDDAKSSLFR